MSKSHKTVPDIRLPGRLRANDICALLRISKYTFYDRIKKGIYPAATGREGRMVWWSTEAFRPFVEAPAPVTQVTDPAAESAQLIS